MLIILTCLSLFAAASSDMTGFIVGGKEVPIEDWPFIAFIFTMLGKNGVGACGGSLISSQTVLTAAHCLDDATKKKKEFGKYSFFILMGNSEFLKSTMKRNVSDYETHAQYDPDLVAHDIGVMFLEQPVTFGSSVKKVLLMTELMAKSMAKAGGLAVAGWGRFSENSTSSKYLKSVNQNMIETKLCYEYIDGDNVSDPGIICGGKVNATEYAYRQINLVICASLLAIAMAEMEGFIVGGNEAAIENWPFICFIMAHKGKNAVDSCGGSLISSQTVLTAAHCLDDLTNDKKDFHQYTYTIYMGHIEYLKSKMKRDVLDYQTHENYDPADVKFDIGIMFLVAPVNFQPNVKKVLLMTKNMPEDGVFSVAGWGFYGPQPVVSKILKELKQKLISKERCHEYLDKGDGEEVDPGVICGGKAGGAEYAYSGDSGGPLARTSDQILAGIVSYRLESQGITIYTSVAYYHSWIERTQLALFQKHCPGAMRLMKRLRLNQF